LTGGGNTAQEQQAISQEPSSHLQLTAANNGYFPNRLYAMAGTPVTLVISTDRVASCARDFVIASIGYETLLPTTGTVSVEIPPQQAGTVMRFSCSMGMYTGEILFK
jgi:plastocyanin domain-containing protein